MSQIVNTTQLQMNTCLIVHLTDLHIKQEDADLWTEQRALLIAQSAARDSGYEACLLVVSGDSSYSGQPEQFEIAEAFLSHLTAALTRLTNCITKVVVAPGNHDCDFSEKSPLRDFARTQKTEATLGSSELINKLAEPLRNFKVFESKTDTFPFTERVSVHKSGVLSLEKHRIQLRVFNSPLYSTIQEQKGDLFLPLETFEKGWEPGCIRVAVIHHPSHWFDQSISRGIRSALRANAHLTLYGHEHIPEVNSVNGYALGSKAASVEVDGAVLQEDRSSSKSSFISLNLDLNASSLQSLLHSWDKDSLCFVTQELSDLSRSGDWIDLPKCERHFSVSPAFEERLNDPGIVAMTNTGRAVKLGDLYVPPDLASALKGKSGAEEIFSSKLLFDLERFEGGAVLQGDEKFGKTALLYRLFDGFHAAGLVPIYLPLRDHKIKASDDFRKVLRSAIKTIYPNESEDSFLAVTHERRIFLVDDIDVLRTESLRTTFIDFLKSRCAHFFATTTIKTQLSEVLTHDTAGTIGQIRQVKIDRFNSAKRSEMIHNWVITVEKKEDDEELLARVDYLEKGATAALGHNMVPRVPHMLLIFLQSSSASSPTKLESGALAHYYTYLVTQHLLTSGIKREEIEEYLSIARLISFQMHKEGRIYITSTELEACNKIFSERYIPGSLQSRLNVLRNAKLLEEYGADAYQWRHGYFHYLFLGEYLGKHIHDPAIRAIIDDMCQHLYVRSNANAFIFLVHFSKDSSVFLSIQKVIEGLFKTEQKLKLGYDTKGFKEVMQDVRELYVPTEGAIAQRKKRHQRVDENERRNGDGLSEAKKTDSAISTLEELIVLFKTSEIVGQVLKEQYASIERATREPMVVALLDAFLRASGKIIREMTVNKDLLHKFIEKKLGELGSELTAEERANAAQEFVSELVQMFMFAFFQKLGDCVSSEKTLDLIRNISWPDELEPKVFLLTCELNLQRPIPLGNIDSLLKLADSDPAFVALIRNLVQLRISMFHTRAPDLQALGKRFKLPLRNLNAIDFRETRTR